MGELIDSPMHRALKENRQMNTHTIQLEPGALDHIPIVKLATMLSEYGVVLVSEDGRLVIRRADEGLI